MTYALWLAFFRNDMGFGGNNGLTDFKDLLGFNLQLPGTRLGLYIASAVGLGSAYLLCRFITTSKLGRVLLAVRDAESRVRFLGYSVTGAKLFVFTVSAVLAGIAGALYVPQVGIINPSEFSPANSIEIAIWVAVGGRGTLAGRGARRGAGQPRQELADRRGARDLAVLPRRAVRADDPGLPARHRRHCRAMRALAARRGRAAPRRRRRPPPRTGVMEAPPPDRRDVMLYFDGVTVSFDGFKALNDLSLVLEEGELRTIIGPNGAGKTTMMDVVTGKTRPDSGEVFFRGTRT